MTGARRWVPTILFAATTVVANAHADKAACVKAYEHAQQLKMSNKLREAKKELVSCADPSCPASLRNDCTTWIAEVDATMPSIVIAATDASGNDVLDARASIDGTMVTERLDGTPIPVDPGEHQLRLERAGSEPVTKTFVARTGEKLRRIAIAVPRTAPPPPPSASAPASAPPPPPPPSVEPSGGDHRTLAYVIGGVGAVGLAAGAVTGLLAFKEKSTADADCTNLVCTADGKAAVDTGRTYGTVSTIAFGVGIVGIGAAAYLLLTSHPSETSSKNVAPVVASDGKSAFAGVRGAW